LFGFLSFAFPFSVFFFFFFGFLRDIGIV